MDCGPTLAGWTTWVLVREASPEIFDWLIRSTERGALDWFCIATDAPTTDSTMDGEVGKFVVKS